MNNKEEAAALKQLLLFLISIYIIGRINQGAKTIIAVGWQEPKTPSVYTLFKMILGGVIFEKYILLSPAKDTDPFIKF